MYSTSLHPNPGHFGDFDRHEGKTIARAGYLHLFVHKAHILHTGGLGGKLSLLY